MCVSTIAIRSDTGIIHVPCGKCYQCLQKRRSEWTFRLTQEMSISKNPIFLTLTYDEENIPYSEESGIVSLKKKDLTDFFKRLKERNKKYSVDKVVYYAVGEYGEKGDRPHYHAIIFNLEIRTIIEINSEDEKKSIWKLGNIFIGEVSQASIHYVTGYVVKKNRDIDNREPCFSVMSKGIGKNYLTKAKIYSHLRDMSDRVRFIGGKEIPMPRYYRDRIFSKPYKEKIRENNINENNVREKKLMEKAKKRRVDYFERIRKNELEKEKKQFKTKKGNL